MSCGRKFPAIRERAFSLHSVKSFPGEMVIISEEFELEGFRGKAGAEPVGIEFEQGRAVIREDEEGADFFQRDAQPREIGETESGEAADGKDAVDVFHAESGDAQQGFAGSGVDVEREFMTVPERPREFRIDVEIEERTLLADDLAGGESVMAHEPVGLVEPVFADERRGFGRKDAGGVWDRAEGRVVDALQPVGTVEFIGPGKEIRVRGCIGADDDLGALSGGVAQLFVAVAFPVRGILEFVADAAHGLFGASEILFRGEDVEALLFGQFEVDADAVGVTRGFLDERGRGFGDRLEMDVAPEIVNLAERFRDGDDALHRVVRVARDAGTEEEPLDVVPLVEIEGEIDGFLHGEGGAAHVAGSTVDTVVAIVDAAVGEQDFQQGDASSVRGVAVANARSAGGPDAAAIERVPFCRARAGAGSVVFRGVGQDGEFGFQMHDQKNSNRMISCPRQFFPGLLRFRLFEIPHCQRAAVRIMTGFP